MEIGDKVLYIHNDPFQGRKDLNGAHGIIQFANTTYEIGDGLIGYYNCKWVSKNGKIFEWGVPIRDVRKLKRSDLS